MSRSDQGFDDITGNKPFKEVDVIDDDKHKAKYHEDDIKGYPGKWCVWLVGRDGQQGANDTTHDLKEQAEQEIKDIKSGKITVFNAHKNRIPISYILSMFPMPIQ